MRVGIRTKWRYVGKRVAIISCGSGLQDDKMSLCRWDSLQSGMRIWLLCGMQRGHWRIGRAWLGHGFYSIRRPETSRLKIRKYQIGTTNRGCFLSFTVNHGLALFLCGRHW